METRSNKEWWDLYTITVFGHREQIHARNQQEADEIEAKENGCMPFRHVYDGCPYMKDLLDGPEDIDRHLYTPHDCKDHD